MPLEQVKKSRKRRSLLKLGGTWYKSTLLTNLHCFHLETMRINSQSPIVWLWVSLKFCCFELHVCIWRLPNMPPLYNRLDFYERNFPWLLGISWLQPTIFENYVVWVINLTKVGSSILFSPSFQLICLKLTCSSKHSSP